MEAHTYLGIDFGTTNSFICECDPAMSVTTVKLDESVSGGSLPTAVLWESGAGQEEGVRSIGLYALYRFAGMHPDERKNCRLAIQFKPDLAASQQAQKDTRAFLCAVQKRLTQSGKVPTLGDGAGVQVVIGVPSNWGGKERELLIQLANEAGYGQVLCVQEPLGALVSHLDKQKITPQEARKGVLVIDFGGGTLDVALLCNGKVVRTWGDPLLGGRLFDDLFFQWCLEQDSSLLTRWQKDGTVLYHHMLACREMKEAFSRCMAMEADGSRLAKFSYRLTPGPGGLDICADAQIAFERRCSNYTPSGQLRQMLPISDTRYERFLTRNIDLFSWIRRSIAESPDGPVHPGQVETVILTGGSTAWPFMRTLVESVFHQAKIVTSPDPEAAIAEGLARLEPLLAKNRKTIEILRQEKPSKVAEFRLELQPVLDDIVAQIAEDIAVDLYDRRITPALSEFRKKGGALSQLKKRLNDECIAFQPAVPDIGTRRASRIQPILQRKFDEFRRDWLGKHGLTEIPSIPKTSLAEVGGIDVASDVDALLRPLVIAISALAAAITGVLCGGGGIALIMSGPIGWLIGAIIGFAAALGFSSLLDKIPLPSWLTRFCLWESRFDKLLRDGRAKTKQAIVEKLQPEIDRIIDGLLLLLTDAFDQTIESLSFIDTMFSRD